MAAAHRHRHSVQNRQNRIWETTTYTNSSELHQFKRTTSIQANYINSSDLYINSNDLHQFRRLHQFAWTCMCTKWLVYLLKQVIGNSLKDFSLITKVSEIHFKNFFGEGKALWRPKIFRYLGKTSSLQYFILFYCIVGAETTYGEKTKRFIKIWRRMDLNH